MGSYPHIHRLVHPLPGPYPLLPPPDLDKEGRVDNQRDTPPNTRLTVQPIRATSESCGRRLPPRCRGRPPDDTGYPTRRPTRPQPSVRLHRLQDFAVHHELGVEHAVARVDHVLGGAHVHPVDGLGGQPGDVRREDGVVQLEQRVVRRRRFLVERVDAGAAVLTKKAVRFIAASSGAPTMPVVSGVLGQFTVRKSIAGSAARQSAVAVAPVAAISASSTKGSCTSTSMSIASSRLTSRRPTPSHR